MGKLILGKRQQLTPHAHNGHSRRYNQPPSCFADAIGSGRRQRRPDPASQGPEADQEDSEAKNAGLAENFQGDIVHYGPVELCLEPFGIHQCIIVITELAPADAHHRAGQKRAPSRLHGVETGQVRPVFPDERLAQAGHQQAEGFGAGQKSQNYPPTDQYAGTDAQAPAREADSHTSGQQQCRHDGHPAGQPSASRPCGGQQSEGRDNQH